MRLTGLVGAAVLLVAQGVVAAPGDPLVVTGNGVNVRSGPGTDNRILLRVYRDQQVIELDREGEWVRLEIAGTAGQEGWIHSSLLAPAAGDAARPAAQATEAPEASAELADDGIEPGDTVMVPETETQEAALAPEPEPEPETTAAGDIAPAAGPLETGGPEVERFKESVDYLNSRAMQVAGVDLFTGIKSVDDDRVTVGITDAWTTVPPAGQRSYLNTLLDRWSAAKGGSRPVSIQIVDAEGQVLAEGSRP